MDNRDCIWGDYSVDKGYYCTFVPDKPEPCPLKIPCMRYCSSSKVKEYIRYLMEEHEKEKELLMRLP